MAPGGGSLRRRAVAPSRRRAVAPSRRAVLSRSRASGRPLQRIAGQDLFRTTISAEPRRACPSCARRPLVFWQQSWPQVSRLACWMLMTSWPGTLLL